MTHTKTFNDSSYNGARPFVLMYTDVINPARGDVHGPLGIARRIAEKLGAELLVVDKAGLDYLMPGEQGAEFKLRSLFNARGVPDFFFSPDLTLQIDGLFALDLPARGVTVRMINEDIPNVIDLPFERHHNFLVPHHITPKMFEQEGRLFAKKFGPILPRPFVAAVAGCCDNPKEWAEKMYDLARGFDRSTIFLNSYHRTNSSHFRQMKWRLQDKLRESEKSGMKIVVFDYEDRLNNVWNPYIGLLDQADHIVVDLSSRSLISEALSTGKAVHLNLPRSAKLDSLGIRSIFNYEAGAAIRTERIAPIDLTSECADILIERRRQLPRGFSHYS